MNIGIDARVLERKITGIGRYLEDILKGLPSFDSINSYYLFSYNNLGVNPDYYNNISTCKPFLNDKLFSPFWLNFVLPQYLKKYNIDLFFTPNHLIPVRKISVNSIITVHDVANKKNNLYHSKLYRLYANLLLPKSLGRSHKIITISNSAKKDIIKMYAVNEEKIKVIYRYADKKFESKTINEDEKQFLKRKFSLTDKFILYVGVIENRKNILGILKTADIVYEDVRDLSFVLIGRKGYGSSRIIQEIYKRSKNVNYLGPVDDDDLIKIYNLALAFLFPSKYEGFGLPPLEAMQTGIPVLTSNCSSLPEVVGEGGIIKDPDDAEGFAEEIVKLYNDSGYYKMKKVDALKQSLKFNCENSILELVNTFNELKK